MDKNVAKEQAAKLVEQMTSRRHALGLSPTKVAAMLGVSTPAVYSWEARTPRFPSLLAQEAIRRWLSETDPRAKSEKIAGQKASVSIEAVPVWSK